MLEKAVSIISAASKIAVYTHKNPDGDAIGSAFALKLALLSLGKLAEVYLEDGNAVKLFPFTKNVDVYPEIPGAMLCENDCDLRICVDCADKKRLGVKVNNFTGNTMAIDHHATHVEFADFTLLDGDAASCGEIIYSLIRALGVEVTSDIADNLYMAIVSDTGGFKYPAVKPETLRIAADLIEKGANFTEIYRSIFDTYSMEFLNLTKIAIDRIQLYCDGKIAVLTLDNADFAAAGIAEDSADRIVDLPRNINGVEVSVYVRRRKDGETKVSLRANGDVNVAELARKFNGGGHIRAAGFETTHEPEIVIAEVIEALRGNFQ
ncbi:MAG: bifunctional oligoribonuclease/PAP phosphatase NrnA [Oscillospiraceae bacterium]|nr:bifunctional oligoribonuclease/PAP phosphatase NrnA [Oscillospiraceae bacterium]